MATQSGPLKLMAHTDPEMTWAHQKAHARKVLRVETMLPYRVPQPDNAVREARAVYRVGASRQGQEILPENSLSESRFTASTRRGVASTRSSTMCLPGTSHLHAQPVLYRTAHAR
jgi:hypothetical protein